MAGLAAAWEFSSATELTDVTVLEAADRVGGKLRAEHVSAGGLDIDLDVGADAMLARRPEGLQLVAEIGLTDEVVHPTTSTAYVLARGRLRTLPARTVMGVPTDLTALARSGVVSPAGLLRAGRDRVRGGEPLTTDVTVADAVGARLGAEVVDALVEPLLGGVYAGRADTLGLRATLPDVADVLAQGGSLMRGLRKRLPVRDVNAPVFAGLSGGMATFPAAIAGALVGRGVDVRTSVGVTEVVTSDGGWRVLVDGGKPLEADGVVVAVPARPAAALVAPHAPAASAELRAIEYADVGIVTLVYPSSAHRGHAPGSGFLVPASAGRLMKACTWSSAKWGRLDLPDHVVVRCSVGRAGEAEALARDDADLVAAMHRELATIVPLGQPPTASLVTRWPDALPQYGVGHLDRVAHIESALALTPTMRLAGAAYRGVGIPAVIQSGRSAARQVLDAMGQSQHG
jgi:oxygen-dependent protoporphyrinogen oxidase